MKSGRTIIRLVISLLIIWICIQIIGRYCFIVVSGDSMEPTLFSGDLLFVKKFPEARNISGQNPKLEIIASRFIIKTGNDSIKNNDIVILTQPFKYKKKIVKRCVGLPGDLICNISQDSLIVYKKSDIFMLYTSGFPISQYDFTNTNLYSKTVCEEMEDFSSIERKIRIPSEGYHVQLKQACYQTYEEIFSNYTTIDFDEADSVFYQNGEIINEYIFKHDYFFLIGDNMLNSYDSRQLGAFPKKFIFGKVLSIFSCHSNIKD